VSCNSEEWKKITLAQNFTWQGDLQEAVLELMTTTGDRDLPDMYVDDCKVFPPEGTGSGTVGGVLIPGITDDVTDGKPDAGAYEYGGKNADWQAGSTLSPQPPLISGIAGTHTGPPAECALHQNYPNPFNSSTQISFTLAAPKLVRLDVFDLLGRRVRTLVNSRLGSGTFKIRWDGLDERGVRVASGVYIYRLSSAGQSPTRESNRKLLLLR
jgi:hypothetical protein